MKKNRRYLGFWGDPNGLLGRTPIRNPIVKLLIHIVGYALLAVIVLTLTYIIGSWCYSGIHIP